MVSSEALMTHHGTAPGKSSGFSVLSWVKEPDASSSAEDSSALGKLNMVLHFHCLDELSVDWCRIQETKQKQTKKQKQQKLQSVLESHSPILPPTFSTHSHQPNGGPTDWMESKSTFVCKNCSQMFYTEKGLSSHMCFHSDQWPSPRGKQEQQVKGQDVASVVQGWTLW